MALEDFRKLRITLDKADRPVYQKLVAKEGDIDGRELEVQLVNRDKLSNLKNVKLTLFWKNLAVGNQGDKEFEAVDREEGLFKVAYPKSMLNKGDVTAYVAIYQDGERVTNTLNFTIEVEGNGYDAQTAIASDDFQALNKALARINQYESDIEDIKSDIIKAGDSLIEAEEKRIGEVLDKVEPRLEGIEKQFDDVLNSETEDGEVKSARTSSTTGEDFKTVGRRMDDVDEQLTLNDLDRQERFKVYLEITNGKPRLRTEDI